MSSTDPNVKIPPSVVAASKRADELHAASIAPPEPTPPVTEPSNPPPAPPPETEWKRRYDAMKGRFDKSEAAARTLGGQVDHLQRVMASMQAPTPAPAPAARADVRFVDDKLRTEYGEEFLDVVGKRTQEVVAPELEAVRAELATVKQALGSVTNKVVVNDQEKFYREMGESLSNWDEINHDPEFKDWLNLTDPYSGAIRLKLLQNAFAQSNAPRVLAFFKGFIAEQAATRPANERSSQPGANTPPTVDLATLAAPGRARQAAANAPPEKPTITRASIAEFYSAVQKGEYRGREADKIAQEKLIFDAQREGRIR